MRWCYKCEWQCLQAVGTKDTIGSGAFLSLGIYCLAEIVCDYVQLLFI